MITKYFIKGKEVTREQARAIIVSASSNVKVVVTIYTEFTSKVDGITYESESEQVYQAGKLVVRA